MPPKAVDPRLLAQSPAAFREALMLPGARGPVRYGPALADFQRRDFAHLDPALLAVRDGRKPLVTRFWIERTKGASKDTDMAVSLLWLLAFSQRMLTCQVAAADGDQADELRRAAKGIVRVNPWLQKVIEVQEWRIINTRTESAVEIIPADIAGSHGARPDVLVINEISHIPDGRQEFVDNLLDNAAKVPHGLVVVMTNAGFEDSWQYKIREVARTSPGRWYFSQYTDPAPWIDPAELEERRRATSAARFNRLWRGIWCSDAGDALDPADIDACTILAGPQDTADPETLFVGGIDLGIRADQSAITILAVNPRLRRVELALCQSWAARKGRDVNLLDVLNSVKLLHSRFTPRRWLVDPWQAILMAQLMRRAGMTVEEVPFTAGNLDKMASALINSFKARSVALYNDPQLLTDLRSFQLEDRGRHWRLIVKRNAQGHADRGTSFVIALPAAIELLRRGEYAAPDSMVIQRDDPARYGLHFHPAASSGPRHGVLLRNQTDGWERQTSIVLPGSIQSLQ